MSKQQNADRYLTRRWPYGQAALTYYVRVTGNDNNDGLTPATAFATLERALHFMAIAEVNERVIIDVTGMTISSSSVLNLGGTTLGGLNFDLDLTATSPNNFFSRRHRQIRSELTLVQGLTVTGQAFDAVSGILTLTVADALVANALRGRFAVGAALSEYGTIRSNTGGAGPNTIEVCRLAPAFTLPVNVYAPGATLNFGDAANFFEQAIYLLALCDWNLQGLTITSNGPKAAALSVFGAAAVSLTLCDIVGLQVSNRAVTTIDGCFVRDRIFTQDGGGISATQSYFRALDFLCHGSGADGLNEIIGCCFDASVTPFGGGNVESAYNFGVENCEFSGATGVAVQAIGGVSRLRNCVVENNGGSGISVQDNAVLTVDNVQGAGNVGYGLEARYGAMVKRAGASAVTGTINDLFVGALGGLLWAVTPVTDLNQLVRVGV